MRSSKPHEVIVNAVGVKGAVIPPFIGVIHRHFQKSLPAILDTREVTLFAPVDLLEFLIPEPILDRIESIEVTYGR